MSSERYFSYYYGRECEQFSFFRIPKLLISDQYFSNLSAEAKLLYGLMLDRMCLSQRNGWFDDKGRVYIIFPQKEIQRDLRVGKNTASRLAIALEECGLIRRIHRGQGMPDLIYVMNFASGERPGEPEYDMDLPEELALAAGFDSSSEARHFFHGESGVLSQKQETVKNESADAASFSRKETENDNVAMRSLSENDGANIERKVPECDTGCDSADSKIIRMAAAGASVGVSKAENDLSAEAERPCSSADCWTPVNPEYLNKQNSEGEEFAERIQGLQTQSRGLKNKPLGRSLKSKPLDSQWKTSDQRFKNQTSTVPKMGTENKTNINIYNISSPSISSTTNGSTSCFSRRPPASQSRREDGVNTGGLQVAISKSNFNSANSTDYSEGLSYVQLIEEVKERIEYDALTHDYGEKEVSIFPHLIAEMIYICRNKMEVRVGQCVYNAEILKQRYLTLTYEHIRHILFTIQEKHISPGNIRNYYIQMLYNAPVTTGAYYVRRYDHDMYSKMVAG